ncbi:LegC family aminotransferase [Halodesulfovibrio marinisediminis]|uniref:Aminotransferase, LLPSF_NHT_00031 family n=1 Tax=Halodesulfovibrio marinisediminis DSM 17456 TaxID=1121457 RepID=A0A1N6FTJ1_9BACT|nr:LegC family aminotransferase [Halodesulfovibrio marinisediminis]SIN98511.1 aminotransferase, LLPSF_NHT_00031 family [Halodesulfovibrio marinisediminis DSM 17456]
MLNSIIPFIRSVYSTDDFIPLHAPVFEGNEHEYVSRAIKSTFVSSVGKYVDQFEKQMEALTGTGKAVATVNGTAALHTALVMAGVRCGDFVITQALTFVATCNALHHMGATPIFVDVSKVSLGLCPIATEAYLDENAHIDGDGQCIHTETGRRIQAIVPMHTFGHPVQLGELDAICEKWNLVLVEDAAESLGSYYEGQHTGTIGEYGAVSFNGNKIVTTGGGGVVLCNQYENGVRAKHLTTTAKKPHPYEFFHDEPGFNYRMPNLNAALGCGQLEKLAEFLESKRRLALCYQDFFEGTEFEFVKEPPYAKSNYWLNAIICPSKDVRDRLLQVTNSASVMTRPVWTLMHRLPAFSSSPRGPLCNSESFESRIVNLPSSPPMD